MLKQTTAYLLSCAFLLSSTQAISQSTYAYSSKNCQMTQGLFSLDKECIKKNSATKKGLLNQYKYLQRTWRSKKKSTKKSPIPRYQLVTSIKALLKWHNSDGHLADYFELHDLKGDRGNYVDMTGYYTPILLASRYRSQRYQYPIYKVPNNYRRLFSRKKITSGGLSSLGLEIAWVEDPIALFYGHIQGSIVLQFPNGKQSTLRYAASNKQPFRRISSYMLQRGFIRGNPSRTAITQWLQQNPHSLNKVLDHNSRYVFFREDKSLSTASGLGLIAGHSVAVDTRHIPFGSVLLAEIPISYRYNGTPVYEWRLLFPQDRGIAIKGAARLDLYTGKGDIAREIANKVTGVRRVYLLLSKRTAHVAMRS